MSLLSKLVLMAVTMLTAACATLPQKQLDLSRSIEIAEPEYVFPYPIERARINHVERTDQVELYEKAKAECAEGGGGWVLSIHTDDFQTYRNTYSCRKDDASDPPAGEEGRSQMELLPYSIAVTFSQRNNVILKFERIYSSPEQSDQNDER